MINLNKKLIELAKANLPHAEVEGIKQMFEENEYLKEEVEDLKEKLEDKKNDIRTFESTIAKLEDKVSELEKEISKHKNIDDREKSVRERELNLDLSDLKIECEKEKAVLVLEMFKTVFANRVLRETIHKNGHEPISTNVAISDHGSVYHGSVAQGYTDMTTSKEVEEK